MTHWSFPNFVQLLTHRGVNKVIAAASVMMWLLSPSLIVCNCVTSGVLLHTMLLWVVNLYES